MNIVFNSIWKYGCRENGIGWAEDDDDDNNTYALKKIISPSYFLNSRCNIFGKLVTLNGP